MLPSPVKLLMGISMALNYSEATEFLLPHLLFG